MKLELESTAVLALVNGAVVRQWRGRTAKGVEVIAYIAAIQVPTDGNLDELKAELEEISPPSGVCSMCGCTDHRACKGGCSWADPSHTLCTRCV